jgi:hypothetical protein
LGSLRHQLISAKAPNTILAMERNPSKAMSTATCMMCFFAFGALSAATASKIRIKPMIPGIKAVQLLPNSSASPASGALRTFSQLLDVKVTGPSEPPTLL